jgi:hypothetical protein
MHLPYFWTSDDNGQRIGASSSIVVYRETDFKKQPSFGKGVD